MPSEWVLQIGRDKLAEARSLAFSARAALAAGDAAAEACARAALAVYRSAMNWLEDSPEFETPHVEMDALGLLCREQWPDGCAFATKGNDFAQECPVPLAHNRIGLSTGMLANALCSVCGNDVTTCSHPVGDTILVVAALVGPGWCSICSKHGCTEHTVGQTYATRVGTVVTEVYEVEEVSIVNRPNQPDARIMSVSISRTEFVVDGVPLPDGAVPICDWCLSDCGGVIEHDD
jgi:hypothetical protein